MRRTLRSRRIIANLVLTGTMMVTVAVVANAEGWFLAGSAPKDYEWGTDRSGAHGGTGSGFLRSRVSDPKGFGTAMQTFVADRYLDKRLKMSGWVKSEDVRGWSGLWMRVDGSGENKMLSFDNMQDRPIKGTSPWKRYEVVLDVPPNSKAIAFGALLHGSGRLWLDDVGFEVVDKSVPVTGAPVGAVPAAPENLNFED